METITLAAFGLSASLFAFAVAANLIIARYMRIRERLAEIARL